MDCTYERYRRSALHIDRVDRISILLWGKLRETANRQEEYAGPGSLVFKPGRMPHENYYGPRGARILTIVCREEKLFGEALEHWQWFHGPGIAPLSFRFLRELKKQRSEDDLLELVIDLMASSGQGEGPISSPEPSWFSRLEERLLDEYATPLQTRQLAAWMDLHPVYLARVFRHRRGRSIKDYLQQIRISRAIDDLVESPKPLVDIALDHGFSDQSHLSRILKRDTGFSPGYFRRWVEAY